MSDWRVASYDPVIDANTDVLDKFLAGLPVGEVIAKLKEAAMGGKFMVRVGVPVEPPAAHVTLPEQNPIAVGSRVVWSRKAMDAARDQGTTDLAGQVLDMHVLDVGIEYLISWSNDAGGVAGVGWQPAVNISPAPAPFVNVTEVEGHVIPPDGVHAWNGDALKSESPRAVVVNDLVPPEARWPEPAIGPGWNSKYKPGPRGRFRITVEFWPEKP